jgi:hypothetical protein
MTNSFNILQRITKQARAEHGVIDPLSFRYDEDNDAESATATLDVFEGTITLIIEVTRGESLTIEIKEQFPNRTKTMWERHEEDPDAETVKNKAQFAGIKISKLA